jgi:hypothetical protein
MNRLPCSPLELGYYFLVCWDHPIRRPLDVEACLFGP